MTRSTSTLFLKVFEYNLSLLKRFKNVDEIMPFEMEMEEVEAGVWMGEETYDTLAIPND